MECVFKVANLNGNNTLGGDDDDGLTRKNINLVVAWERGGRTDWQVFAGANFMNFFIPSSITRNR